MDPTNNLAEQDIREHVVIRKIIGTFGSKSGSQNYQYIASLLSTWRLKGLSMFVEMDKNRGKNCTVLSEVNKCLHSTLPHLRKD